MIASRRAAMRQDPEAFADGLRAWMRGEDASDPDAQAAGQIVAETLLLHRRQALGLKE